MWIYIQCGSQHCNYELRCTMHNFYAAILYVTAPCMVRFLSNNHVQYLFEKHNTQLFADIKVHLKSLCFFPQVGYVEFPPSVGSFELSLAPKSFLSLCMCSSCTAVFCSIVSPVSESLSESCPPSVTSFSGFVTSGVPSSCPTGTAPFLWGRMVKNASFQSLFSRYARIISNTRKGKLHYINTTLYLANVFAQ